MRSLEEKIIPREKLAEFCKGLGGEGKRIVTTNGCFDLLHLGHITYLIEAKKLGDILLVGINSDNSVRKLKGPCRPIQSEQARARQIAALESVDFVTIFPEDTPEAFLELAKPQIHTKGGDYSPEALPEKKIVEFYGGKIVCLSLIEGFSTTRLIEQMKVSS